MSEAPAVYATGAYVYARCAGKAIGCVSTIPYTARLGYIAIPAVQMTLFRRYQTIHIAN